MMPTSCVLFFVTPQSVLCMYPRSLCLEEGLVVGWKGGGEGLMGICVVDAGGNGGMHRRGVYQGSCTLCFGCTSSVACDSFSVWYCMCVFSNVLLLFFLEGCLSARPKGAMHIPFTPSLLSLPQVHVVSMCRVRAVE